MDCLFCGNTFANKSNLNYHQKTAKYCLKIQGKLEKKFICELCEKNFSTKQNLTVHRRHVCRGKLSKYKELVEKKTEEYEVLKQECNQHKEEILIFRNKLENQKQEIKKLKKLLQDEKIENRERIHELEKKLAHKEGKFDGYDTAVQNNKLKATVNNYIHPKLLSVKVDTIRPFTIETVRQELEDGNFTKEMFENGPFGILEFVSNIISIENENGEIERSYACTDSSRNKFHRLVESKEWKTDNGAHFLSDVLNQLQDPIKHYFTEMLERRRDLGSQYGEEDCAIMADFYSQKIESLRPIYLGVQKEKGKDRDKLFTTLRNKISGITSI